MIDKRENLKNIFERKKVQYIPFIPNAISFSAYNLGYRLDEIVGNHELFSKAIINTRQEFNFDGLCAGVNFGIVEEMAGHLKNTDGLISKNGEDTIKNLDDLMATKEFNPHKSSGVRNVVENIRYMKEVEPNEPIYVIISNPSQTAIKIMGPKDAYRKMIKNPGEFKNIAKFFESLILSAVDIFIKEGLDFIWSPMPQLSGECISKKTYFECAHISNKTFNYKIMEKGCKLVIHTCGKFDDRFELVLKEGADAWHIADTKTQDVYEKYGKEIVLMGNVPCISVLLEKSSKAVYDYGLNECKIAGKNGTFILSGDCDISPLTPKENVKSLVKAAQYASKILI